MTKLRKRNATLMKLVEPNFLSIVRSPANKTPFKVIRSAPEDGIAERGDVGLLSIEFPLGIGQEEADALLSLLHLGEDYELATSDSGRFYLRRAGVPDELLAKTTRIDMGHGFSASVVVEFSENTESSSLVDAGVQLLRMDFDREAFTLEQVKDWLEKNEIDFQPNGVVCSERTITVQRHDCGEELQSVQIMPGVHGAVRRAAVSDVPEKVYRQVVEAAYGNWGWGQVDFRAAIADREFSEEAPEAVSVLSDVLHNVIWSNMTLAEKKALARQACAQFADYMDGLIDALPTDVVEQIRSTNSQETTQMPSAKKEEDIQRQDAAGATDESQNAAAEGAAENLTGTDATPAAEETITRAAVEEIVKAAVAESMTAVTEMISGLKTELTSRQDQKEDEPKSDASPASASGKETIGAFGEMLKDITDKVERMSEAFSAMKGELEELAGTTVSRSDSGDVSPGETQVQRSESSPFKGIFGSRPFNL
jgi:hypothetical protein